MVDVALALVAGVMSVEDATDPLFGTDVFLDPADFFADVVFAAVFLFVAVVLSVVTDAFLETLLETLVFVDALEASSFGFASLREVDLLGAIANDVW